MTNEAEQLILEQFSVERVNCDKPLDAYQVYEEQECLVLIITGHGSGSFWIVPFHICEPFADLKYESVAMACVGLSVCAKV